MPMRTELYPPTWKEISLRIRERDGQKCKECGVNNGAVGYRDLSGFHEVYNTNDEPRLEVDVICDDLVEQGKKLIKIVLTVAHVHNPDPMDCRDSNLAALCQRCHLRLDADQHRANSAKTRFAKKLAAGQTTLF